jgi:hypothetical protein
MRRKLPFTGGRWPAVCEIWVICLQEGDESLNHPFKRPIKWRMNLTGQGADSESLCRSQSRPHSRLPLLGSFCCEHQGSALPSKAKGQGTEEEKRVIAVSTALFPTYPGNKVKTLLLSTPSRRPISPLGGNYETGIQVSGAWDRYLRKLYYHIRARHPKRNGRRKSVADVVEAVGHIMKAHGISP